MELEQSGCKQMKNRSFRQNRMDVCREGRQGQTYKMCTDKDGEEDEEEEGLLSTE